MNLRFVLGNWPCCYCTMVPSWNNTKTWPLLPNWISAGLVGTVLWPGSPIPYIEVKRSQEPVKYSLANPIHLVHATCTIISLICRFFNFLPTSERFWQARVYHQRIWPLDATRHRINPPFYHPQQHGLTELPLKKILTFWVLEISCGLHIFLETKSCNAVVSYICTL